MAICVQRPAVPRRNGATRAATASWRTAPAGAPGDMPSTWTSVVERPEPPSINTTASLRARAAVQRRHRMADARQYAKPRRLVRSALAGAVLLVAKGSAGVRSADPRARADGSRRAQTASG